MKRRRSDTGDLDSYSPEKRRAARKILSPDRGCSKEWEERLSSCRMSRPRGIELDEMGERGVYRSKSGV